MSDGTSVPQLKVPPAHRAALERLAHITEQEFQALLGRVPVVTSSDDDLNEDESDTRWMLRSLANTRVGREDEFRQALVQADGIDLTPAERELVVDRVVRILDSADFRLLEKATDLSNEHDQLIHDVRILCDVRPVFAEFEDPEAPPVVEGAVVNILLRLNLFDPVAVGMKHVTVALSQRDLMDLEDQVTRAKKKLVAIDGVIKSAGLISAVHDGLGAGA